MKFLITFRKIVSLVCVDIQWLAKVSCFAWPFDFVQIFFLVQKKVFSAVITFRHNWVKNGVLRQEVFFFKKKGKKEFL